MVNADELRTGEGKKTETKPNRRSLLKENTEADETLKFGVRGSEFGVRGSEFGVRRSSGFEVSGFKSIGVFSTCVFPDV